MYNDRPKLKGKNKHPVYKNFDEIITALDGIEFDTIAFECYPGIDYENLKEQIVSNITGIENIFDTSDFILKDEALEEIISSDLTDDELFGKFIRKPFSHFIIKERLEKLLTSISRGKTAIVGVGASQLVNVDKIVYVNINRWEIQLRYKKGMSNWQMDNDTDSWNKKIKRGYYFEWPLGDQIKEKSLPISDYIIDLNIINSPTMIHTEDYYTNLELFTKQPFRLVPYFAPGVWGGKWMQENFKVGLDEVNLAWAFDGVPEENSIIFEIDKVEFEIPANDIVLFYPQNLMGEKVYGRYGKNFPIRFDYLDTMGGQNLSLQVHPTTDYAYKEFNALYTQDESYYIMDCKNGSEVFIGVKEGVTSNELICALEDAKRTNSFDDKKYIHSIKVKKHDHFLIPAGTIHCSGADCVVLEISSTPNRFTFKLWDWDRVDLDGRPRPINVERGAENINYNRDEGYVNQELYNQFEIVENNGHHKMERTGLHASEPIKTERDTFNEKVIFNTDNNVQMLCLVEGNEVLVKSENISESEEGLIVHYGETFVIPAGTGRYSITPVGESKGKYVKIMKAYIG